MINYTYILNGESLFINTKKCIGCGICIEVCPHAVLSIVDKKATIIEKRRCMECGACLINCPFGAITVNKGVGCTSAIISGFLRGTEPDCGCCGCDGDDGKSSCC